MKSNCTIGLNISNLSCQISIGTLAITDDFDRSLIYLFVISFISCLSVLTSSVNTIVWSDKTFKENLFVYLKLESILMAINSAFTAIDPIYNCKPCHVSRLYFASVFELSCKYYLASILEMSAIISGIFGTITCLSLIDQNNKRAIKLTANLNPYVVTLSGIVFAAIMFFYQLFASQIVLQPTNDGGQRYSLVSASFSESILGSVLVYVSFITRDALLVFILILSNVHLAIYTRQHLHNKLKITGDRSDSKTVAINKSKSDLTKMVLIDTSILIFSRLIILVNAIMHYVSPEIKTIYTGYTVNFMPPFSYVFKFFIYYHYNKRFSKVFSTLIAKRVPCWTSSDDVPLVNNKRTNDQSKGTSSTVVNVKSVDITTV
jgi:hypothetical protein